ncbi:MAG: hypothetical protein ACJ8E3_01930 [Sphingomicrobium sp.]
MDNSEAGSNLSLERASRITSVTLVALAVVILALSFVGTGERLTGILAFTEDLVLVPIVLVGLVLARGWAKSAGGWPNNAGYWVAGLIAFVLIAGWAGHYLVFDGYDLSRDEQMATFDTAIFRDGRLFAPIPAAWRPVADALNLTFMLPMGARESWVSAYLPIHAAWRAAVSLVADPALASPLMAAFGGFCMWRIARLLWPASAATQFVCVLLYAGSAQIVVTAMTAFSMSMHLALNLLWLWLFLLDRRRTHAAAMLVGWFATGIHQPLFHPMFVAPFLLLLLTQKRWKLLAAYTVAYALIGMFWLAWPVWLSAQASSAALPVSGTPGISFLDRLLSILHVPTLNSLWLTAANLLRLICWQHLLLVPLAIVGLRSSFREQPLGRALAFSFALPIIVAALLLPWQGYGWGYRYVHPALGSLILLGGYGWHALETRGLDLRPMMARASLFAIVLLIPICAVMGHRLAAPVAHLHRGIASTAADIVIVDTAGLPYADDLVVNRADLSNRPIMLLGYALEPEDLTTVCSLGSVAFVPGPRLAPLARHFRADPPLRGSPHFAQLVAHARAARCRLVSSPNPSERN